MKWAHMHDENLKLIAGETKEMLEIKSKIKNPQVEIIFKLINILIWGVFIYCFVKGLLK